MSGWLPDGCSDKDIDEAAPQDEQQLEELIQCDNCHRMGTSKEVWSSWHPSYGDCTQCYECRQFGKCRYCQEITPLMDLNDYGVCEECEHDDRD